MSFTFTKLFSSITESTIWCEPDRTRLVWICMLAMADQKGRVMASIPGLANRARVPIEDTETAIAAFLAPDKYSRTPDNEGRRIELIDGGWRLLNHAKYRAIRDEESIKESKRNYINRRRAEERENQSNGVDIGRPNAEADTEADAPKVVTTATSAKPVGDPPPAAGATEPPAKPKKGRKEPTGTRLPADWVLLKPWGEWALTERPDWTADTVRTEAAVFADYWHGAAGAKGRKVDWEATWRNWVRRSNAGGSQGGGQGRAPRETDYARSMREKVEQVAPGIAARAPGAAPQHAVDFFDVEAREVAAGLPAPGATS